MSTRDIRLRVDVPDFVPKQQTHATPNTPYSGSTVPATPDGSCAKQAYGSHGHTFWTDTSTPNTSPDESRLFGAQWQHIQQTGIDDPFDASDSSQSDVCLQAAMIAHRRPCPAALAYELPELPNAASMDPLTLWNALYQTERALIETVVQPLCSLPLTDTPALFPHLLTPTQQSYLQRARAMRVRAAATQIPPRLAKNDAIWAQELTRLHREIWKLPLDRSGFSAVIAARKRDFERAILAELDSLNVSS